MRALRFIPVLAAAASFAAPAANAGLLDPITRLVLPSCGATLQPFQQFGDGSSYYGFSNNGFESGAQGWALAGGAYVGSGNEPWYVNGAGGRSLVLPAGSSATSPAFCINLVSPNIRAFVRGAQGDQLRVQVIFRGLTGNLTGILNVGSVNGTGGWAPSQKINSLLALPLLTVSAQIRITAGDGTWQVDDAFVDPFKVGVG